MTRSGGLLGVVLAGGRSERYGRPKWRERVGGASMAARALEALASHVEERGVVGGEPALADLGVPVREDLRPGRGPVAGLETALRWAGEHGREGVVVLACDLPLVDGGVVGALVAAASLDGEVDAVVPRGPRGPEPLCAVYGVGALPAVERILERSEASMGSLLERLRVAWVPVESLAGGGWALHNVNTPGDRARAEARLGCGGRSGERGLHG